MSWIKALFGVRYFNITATGTRPGSDAVYQADVENLPEKHLDEVLDTLLDWDLENLRIKVDVA